MAPKGNHAGKVPFTTNAALEGSFQRHIDAEKEKPAGVFPLDVYLSPDAKSKAPILTDLISCRSLITEMWTCQPALRFHKLQLEETLEKVQNDKKNAEVKWHDGSVFEERIWRRMISAGLITLFGQWRAILTDGECKTLKGTKEEHEIIKEMIED